MSTWETIQILLMPAFTIPIITFGILYYNKRNQRINKAKTLRRILDDSNIRDGAMPKNWKDEIQMLESEKHG